MRKRRLSTIPRYRSPALQQIPPPRRSHALRLLPFIILLTTCWTIANIREGPTTSSAKNHENDRGSPVKYLMSVQRPETAQPALTGTQLYPEPKLDTTGIPYNTNPTLTAVLPVTEETLGSLPDLLHDMVERSSILSHVLLASKKLLMEGVTHQVQLYFEQSRSQNVPTIDIELVAWLDDMDAGMGVRYATTAARTSQILLLDEFGLTNLDPAVRRMLLNPTPLGWPWGPRGIMKTNSGDTHCLMPSTTPQPASYLIPPIVATSNIISTLLDAKDQRIRLARSWSDFGHSVAELSQDGVGGLVVYPENSVPISHAPHWCLSLRIGVEQDAWHPKQANEQEPTRYSPRARPIQHVMPPQDGLVILVPRIRELKYLSAAICKFREAGVLTQILLFEEPLTSSSDQGHREIMQVTTDYCVLPYKTVALLDDTKTTSIQQSRAYDVIITTKGDDYADEFARKFTRGSKLTSPTIISIPLSDLPYTDWIGSLSFDELKSWNVPHIDISVITNDRPQSFARLLASLRNTRYFGDSVNMRINLDQAADEETLRMTGSFDWPYGATFVHHRVVQGGLLPAVAESWFPQSNHSYGLLLEDDVEVSPLFYAWLKMTLLRYKYGVDTKNSRNLFGISLYHQKSTELRPEGRRFFSASDLFAKSGHPSTTPYLSQIPCSWGALYFPEHWREFHAYLSLRLSPSSPRSAYALTDDIVPHSRSNRWTHSWKRYFIELVYLRGYVMLYPNYPNNVSLSTNHLEPGSHVKATPRDTYLKKRELFTVPLMPLPRSDTSPGPLSSGLLELPHQRLPQWTELPSLDLFAWTAPLSTMERRGARRRMGLFHCRSSQVSLFDARQLLCIDDTEAST